MKPIRVFYSELTGQFYATRAYKVDKKGHIEITGEKFNVTQDIAHAIVTHGVEFRKKAKEKEPTHEPTTEI